MHCDKHGVDYEQKEIDLFGNPMLVGTCPDCEREEVEKEAAQEARDAKETETRRYEKGNIEPMYFDATLENFIADTPELVRAKAEIAAMIVEKKGKLVFLGKNGTGKTHLAVCAVKEIGGKIYTMYEISTRIRATYTPKAKEDEIDVVDELARLSLLVVDEIGRTKGSDAEANWLSYVIDKRHVRGLPLILISNKHTKKTCAKGGCENCLENYIGEDIMSRLNENGKLINFTGDDYRMKKRLETK